MDRDIRLAYPERINLIGADEAGPQESPLLRRHLGKGEGGEGCLVLIDAWPMTRVWVSRLLEQNMPETKVVAVSSFAEFLGRYTDHCGTVQLIIVVLSGADLRQDGAQRHLGPISEKLPGVPVIVMAESNHSEDVAEALRQGARGYIPTTLNPTVAVEVLHLVRAGGTFVPASAFLQLLTAQGREVSPAVKETCERLQNFTPRQSDVLARLREGKSNKVIARELRMQESTVKVHVRHIMRKLNARNRTQAVVLASQIESGHGQEETPMRSIQDEPDET